MHGLANCKSTLLSLTFAYPTAEITFPKDVLVFLHSRGSGRPDSPRLVTLLVGEGSYIKIREENERGIIVLGFFWLYPRY